MLPNLLQKPVLMVTHCDGNTVAGQLKSQQNITEQSSIQKKSMMSARSSICQITAQDKCKGKGHPAKGRGGPRGSG